MAALVLYGGDFLTQWCAMLQSTLADNVWIFLVCGLFGSLSRSAETSKGTFGFTTLVAKFCTNQRRASDHLYHGHPDLCGRLSECADNRRVHEECL